MKYIDAEKLKRFVGGLKKTANRNCCDSWGIVPKALEEVEDFITSLQQEQPEVDLEKDAVSFCFDNGINLSPRQAKNIARHFYELGLNARKKE